MSWSPPSWQLRAIIGQMSRVWRHRWASQEGSLRRLLRAMRDFWKRIKRLQEGENRTLAKSLSQSLLTLNLALLMIKAMVKEAANLELNRNSFHLSSRSPTFRPIWGLSTIQLCHLLTAKSFRPVLTRNYQLVILEVPLTTKRLPMSPKHLPRILP